MAVEVIYLQPINYSGAPEDVPPMEYGTDGGEPVFYKRGARVELSDEEHSRLVQFFHFGDPEDEPKIIVPPAGETGTGTLGGDVDQAGATAGAAGSVPNVPGKSTPASSAPARS